MAKADAERDLKDLLAQRATVGEPEARRHRLASFSDVIDTWLAAGCPNSGATSRSRHAKTKSPNTIANARGLLRTHVRPSLGNLRVDRTTTERLEALFNKMAAAGYSTSTVDRTWHYLSQATQYAMRVRLVKSNPAAVVLLPEARDRRRSPASRHLQFAPFREAHVHSERPDRDRRRAERPDRSRVPGLLPEAIHDSHNLPIGPKPANFESGIMQA